MTIANQILPIAGVILGAAATYVGSSFHERAKIRESIDREWGIRKRDSYMAYLISVKKMRLIAAKMAGARSLDREVDPIDLSHGMAELTAADDERSTAQEGVNVYGDEEPILAARRLTDAVWELEWIARGRQTNATPRLWEEKMEAYSTEMDQFIHAVRKDLKVPGEYADRKFRPVHPERPASGHQPPESSMT